jgi:hypothetical protein
VLRCKLPKPIAHQRSSRILLRLARCNQLLLDAKGRLTRAWRVRFSVRANGDENPGNLTGVHVPQTRLTLFRSPGLNHHVRPGTVTYVTLSRPNKLVQIRALGLQVEDNERENRTLVVDDRLASANGSGNWDRSIAPLACALWNARINVSLPPLSVIESCRSRPKPKCRQGLRHTNTHKLSKAHRELLAPVWLWQNGKRFYHVLLISSGSSGMTRGQQHL